MPEDAKQDRKRNLWMRVACAALSTGILLALGGGAFWVTAQNQPIGERMTANESDLRAAKDDIEDLRKGQDKIAALERSNAALEKSNQLILGGIGTAIALLAGICGIMWRAGNKIHEDAVHIRQSNHKLASYMDAASKIPELIEKVDNLPCVKGHVKCVPVDAAHLAAESAD